VISWSTILYRAALTAALTATALMSTTRLLRRADKCTPPLYGQA
jgi:hypothetical protein